VKRPVFAANWKMNHGPSDAVAFMRSFLPHYQRRSDRTVVIFPPALSFAAVAAALAERPDVLAGVQNIHWEDKGAFTGELSAGIARDAGARLALVGHSERRHVFGETDEETARKCGAAARAGLIPMLCVGETLEERERGETESVVLRQLRAGLGGLEPAQLPTVAIAYEPVWAIGTGRNATPADAAQVHQAIRRALRELVGERGGSVPVLYGGSVNLGNVAALLAAHEVDGVLVGGASLEALGWSKLVSTALGAAGDAA
jgi:triosephosphate isomerase